jgi:hypothetical protein
MARRSTGRHSSAFREALRQFVETNQPGSLPRRGREILALLDDFNIELGAYSWALDGPDVEGRS